MVGIKVIGQGSSKCTTKHWVKPEIGLTDTPFWQIPNGAVDHRKNSQSVLFKFCSNKQVKIRLRAFVRCYLIKL